MRGTHRTCLCNAEEALIRRRRGILEVVLDLFDADRWPSSAQAVDAQAIGDLMQPGRHPSVRLPGFRLLPKPEQRLLDDFLGLGRRDQGAGKAEEPRRLGPRQNGESGLVPRRDGLHQGFVAADRILLRRLSRSRQARAPVLILNTTIADECGRGEAADARCPSQPRERRGSRCASLVAEKAARRSARSERAVGRREIPATPAARQGFRRISISRILALRDRLIPPPAGGADRPPRLRVVTASHSAAASSASRRCSSAMRGFEKRASRLKATGVRKSVDERREAEPADDDPAERLARLGAGAAAQDQRQAAEDGRQHRHHHRPQADDRGVAIASRTDCPWSRSWLANSTIRMPFLAIRPTSMTRPIWL